MSEIAKRQPIIVLTTLTNDGSAPPPPPQDGGGEGAPPQDGKSNSGNQSIDKDKVIEELRRENAARRIKEREAEDKLKALADYDDVKKKLKTLEDERLTEEQKTKLRLDELEKSNRDAEISRQAYAAREQSLQLRNAILEQAFAKKIVDPGLAALALENAGKVEYDDKNKPTNLPVLLDELLKEKPYLADGRVITPNPGATNPGKEGAPKTLTMEDVKNMTQSDINKRWDEVAKLMDSSRNSAPGA